jgi:hypothetical protein
MNRKTLSAVIALGLTLAPALAAFAADVTGAIKQASGKPVPGVSVVARSGSGQVLQTAVSKEDGGFTLSGLVPSAYQFSIDLGKSGFKSGPPVAVYLSDKGLTLNWILSATGQPLVTAREGTKAELAADDPFGLTWPQFALVGGTIVGAGTSLGVAAAAGGFSGGSGNGGIASSSK